MDKSSKGISCAIKSSLSRKKRPQKKANFLETHKKGKEAQCTRRRAFSIEAWKAAMYRAAQPPAQAATS